MNTTNNQIQEVQRRTQTIAESRTDIERWANPKQLEPAWNARAQFTAGAIPAGSRVIDLGCGAMALEGFLPAGCSYQPVDVVARDERTIVCDFNRGDFPQAAIAAADQITMLGVAEYIFNLPGLLMRLARCGKPMLLSYCPSDNGLATPRGNLGWVNHHTLKEFTELLRDCGFEIARCDCVDQVQFLFNLRPKQVIAPAPRKVLVLSYANVGNFGDRLGYHLVHSVLPANAIVTHAHFNPWDVPDEDFDLLVLGIGNSLFAPLLNDRLLALLDRIPQKIGIFGTQYRNEFAPQQLHAVIDRLDHWHARYREDVLLYGRERKNVSHFGDWLIDAFPMALGQRKETFRIGNEIWQNLPLDRTIQQIQAFERVDSTRLHPLLCALTSAREVAYHEQREGGSKGVSGKFRSLLIDIFGREMPEGRFWPVDRGAVLNYKQLVRNNVDALRRDLAERLGAGR